MLLRSLNDYTSGSEAFELFTRIYIKALRLIRLMILLHVRLACSRRIDLMFSMLFSLSSISD
jgi:hypothetical protein